MDPSAPIVETAAAKLNLMLHVVGRRPDGYHLLETLFAFTRFGDTLTVLPADDMAFHLDGPFASALIPEPDNLVLRAAHALAAAGGVARPGARLLLNKRIPVAAGLGGGSADAAAALRALNRLWRLDWPLDRLAALATSLGADVPACVHSRPMWGHGVGELLQPARLGFAARPAVLVNPRVPLATPAVFQAFRQASAPFSQPLPSLPWPDGDAVIDVPMLAAWRNDLEPAARHCAPVVGAVGAVLAATPGADLVRLAGSGPTWFALYADHDSAQAAAAAVRIAQPGWWCIATEVAGCSPDGAFA